MKKIHNYSIRRLIVATRSEKSEKTYDVEKKSSAPSLFASTVSRRLLYSAKTMVFMVVLLFISFAILKIKPIVLENFVNIGVNAVIMPGVTLREGSVVGAGAVITEDTEPWTIYVGAPAKPIKKRPKEKMLEYARQLEQP